MNAAEQGREALARWKAAQPDNWFEADRDLQRGLQRLLGDDRYRTVAEQLSGQGAILATKADPLVIQMERQGNQPRLDAWDGIGRRTESVEYDGRYDRVGEYLYGSGVVAMLGEDGNVLHSAALGYLANQLGEAGHNCPIACTAGLVRALRAAASDELKARYLPGLLNADYHQKLDGAQFMTEVQGGSDVGANAVVAERVEGGDGQYRITGEKWFCSNCTADLVLMTARYDADQAGTKGLGLFLVPRLLPNGELNGFRIRRLKEKLGTRAMASGEIDFDGALGYSVGAVDSGFKTMMNHVINTSRLFNASGTLGMARRALITAWTYAEHRGAFGAEIVNYPLVQETLADMRSEVVVLLHGHLHLAALRDRLDTGRADDVEAGFYRVGLNLNKYRTCVSAGEVIRSAIELLGGNGAIESFSVIPRLLRDNIVYENWEGTHNTLAVQILRDMARLPVGEQFVDNLLQRWTALARGPVASAAQRGIAATRELGGQLKQLKSVGQALASLQMRPLSDRMSWLMAATAAAEQAAFDVERFDDDTTLKLLDYFWARRIIGRSGLPGAEHLASLAALVR